MSRLKVLAVVSGDSDGDGAGRLRSSAGGGGDTPARASRGVAGGAVAARGVGGNSGGLDGGSTVVEGAIALELGRLIRVDSHGDGGGAIKRRIVRFGVSVVSMLGGVPGLFE